jgi:endoribonuclease family protein
LLPFTIASMTLTRRKTSSRCRRPSTARPVFDQQHIVVNTVSQLLFDVFSEIDRHTHTTVGTNQLPMNTPVEIEAILRFEQAQGLGTEDFVFRMARKRE